jgi:hypothetical protein
MKALAKMRQGARSDNDPSRPVQPELGRTGLKLFQTGLHPYLH